MNKIFVAPSILSADFSKMGEDVLKVERGGADLIHCDVMDGMFVKNITFGPKMIADIKKCTSLKLDTHLMVVQPERYVDRFIEAGSDFVTIHLEACDCIAATLKYIKSCGIKCGVVISPDTSVESVFDYAPICDMILLMSVHPGFGGQSFISSVLNKISKLRAFLSQNKLNTLLEVDGGITLENVGDVISAGANVIVAGNTVFNSVDFSDTIRKLRG